MAAVLALLGSAAVAQTDAPKGYTGACGPDDPNGPFRPRARGIRVSLNVGPGRSLNQSS